MFFYIFFHIQLSPVSFLVNSPWGILYCTQQRVKKATQKNAKKLGPIKTAQKVLYRGEVGVINKEERECDQTD
jgi:hypothetical protein